MSDTSDVMTTVAVIESRKRRSLYGWRFLVPHSLTKDRDTTVKSNGSQRVCVFFAEHGS